MEVERHMPVITDAKPAAQTSSALEREDLFPIREVARLTGVNPVTLRAWERRYGLLIPQRTSKGHRLYSRADIDRVKEIQLWLGRGLAISKVKALLASQTLESLEQVVDSNWVQLAQRWLASKAISRRLCTVISPATR